MQKKVLLSIFACQPNKGSEAGNGWNWAQGLAKEGYQVHCLTRGVNQAGIEKEETNANIFFHYVNLPFGMEQLYSRSQATMYLYYMLWQYTAYIKAKLLHKKNGFKVVHHATWGSLQMGSFLYKLKIPFIFGPAGGGQKAPVAFKKYFLNQWKSEIKRERLSDLLVKFNPGFKKTIKNAHAVITSNIDTFKMASAFGYNNVFSSLDAALPQSFYPEVFTPKQPQPNSLKLLWVGRFMPRKGVLLVLEVMAKLKNYPITLTIVGDGETKQAIIDKIEECKLQTSVTLTGLVPFTEVRNYYASHDVFFITSLRDSGPVQLIEACAFGLPIVTLNLHGQAMIVNKDFGITCDCSSPEIAIEQLTKAIIHLYQNPKKVTELSQAAYQFGKKHTWDYKIKNIVENYYPK